MEKPDRISWDDVRICLNTAHQVNKKSGVEMCNATITTESLIALNRDAHCFVALEGKKGVKLVQFQPTKKKHTNYYQVTMVRWDDGCPFPNWFLNFMFKLSKIVSKTFFKRN
jgi:hypothetical protein